MCCHFDESTGADGRSPQIFGRTTASMFIWNEFLVEANFKPTRPLDCTLLLLPIPWIVTWYCFRLNPSFLAAASVMKFACDPASMRVLALYSCCRPSSTITSAVESKTWNWLFFVNRFWTTCPL